MIFSVPRTLTKIFCLLWAVCLAVGCSEQTQQDPDTASSAQSSEMVDTVAPESPVPPAVSETPAESGPFKIPDGNIDELFTFLQTVQTAQLPEDMQNPEGAEKFLRAQVGTAMEVFKRIEAQGPDDAAKVKLIQQRVGAYQALGQIDPAAGEELGKLIEGLKDDERPEIRKIVRSHKLTSTARTFFQLSDDGQGKVVKDLVSYMQDYGMDEVSFSLSTQLAGALEQTANPGSAVAIYEQLTKELKKMNEPRLAPQIAKFEGSTRRLRLPGKFMELTGTTAAGEEFDWESYRGKVVLVDFWASWCGPCRAEIPNMKTQLKKYGDKGFAIVGISLDNSLADYQAAVESQELTWVNLMSQNENERGWNSPLAVYYGVSGIPTAILVDKEGKVVSMMARGEQLNVLLDQMLGEPADKEPADKEPADKEPADKAE